MCKGAPSGKILEAVLSYKERTAKVGRVEINIQAQTSKSFVPNHLLMTDR